MANRFGYSTTGSQRPQTSVYADDSTLLIHDDQVKRVLRNTYALLAITLLFSAAIATAAVSFQWKAPGLILTLLGFFGLLAMAWLGLAWLGLAWLGLVWLGLAWLGLAWLGLDGLRCLGLGRVDFAWLG
jgi:FtsH-binding integral membrane protein